MCISKTKAFAIAAIALSLAGLPAVSQAVRQSGSCPMADHGHMGHGVGLTTEINMDNKGIDAGGKLAEAQCGNCHGTYGISIADDIPNLAGQNSLYLCAWLDECRKKGKQCEGHEDIAAKLSDQNIIDLSEFYSHLPATDW